MREIQWRERANEATTPEHAHAKPWTCTPIGDTFQVVIQCASEEELELLYDEFRARNLSVRLLTM